MALIQLALAVAVLEFMAMYAVIMEITLHLQV
jgi:hypothetical protein